jgi:hypothetical protein
MLVSLYLIYKVYKFTEVVADTSEKGEENYSEVVLDALKFASNMGLTCGEGGDEKSLLNLFRKSKRSGSLPLR